MTAGVLVSLAEGVDPDEILVLIKKLRQTSVSHPRRFIRELTAASAFDTGLRADTRYADYEPAALEAIRSATAIVAEKIRGSRESAGQDGWAGRTSMRTAKHWWKVPRWPCVCAGRGRRWRAVSRVSAIECCWQQFARVPANGRRVARHGRSSASVPCEHGERVGELSPPCRRLDVLRSPEGLRVLGDVQHVQPG